MATRRIQSWFGTPALSPLAQGGEPVGIVPYRAGLADAFGKAAIERKRGQRGDQRRDLEAGDDEAVEQARKSAEPQCQNHRQPERQAGIVPEHAKADRHEPDDGADREVDAAGHDDEGHGQRHEPEFGEQPALVQQVVPA